MYFTHFSLYKSIISKNIIYKTTDFRRLMIPHKSYDTILYIWLQNNSSPLLVKIKTIPYTQSSINIF